MQSSDDVQLRPLTRADDSAIATLIRTVLVEFGADRPGFAWQDPDLDHLTDSYEQVGGVYLLAESSEQLLGGAGIAPFVCEHATTCELQKMYLLPQARGRGIGALLLTRLLENARAEGYRFCYLETLDSMSAAGTLYRSFGFEPLTEPWGDSGHHGCDRWYALQL